MAKYGGISNTPEGIKAKYMEFQVALMKLPKIDLKADDAPQMLSDHLMTFISICIEYDQLPSQANYALSLHISRQALQRHLNGHTNIKPAVYDQLHEANNMLGAVIEDNMLSGASNVVGSIFIAKNNFGYKEQSEQIITHQRQALTAEELVKIANSLPEVIDVDFTEVGDPKGIEQKNDEYEAGTAM